MANINNATAIKFANEQIRVLADKYAQLYYLSKMVSDIWTAQGMATLIPNTSDILEDGAPADGRAQITGAMVNGLLTNCQALITDLEASTKLKLNGLLKVAVQPRG
jgi:hypothetical protein